MIDYAERLFAYDDGFKAQNGVSLLCGVDEAGRGPLAGDVFAAAVVLKPGIFLSGLNDSKKLSEAQRDRLYDEILANAAGYAIATASVAEIEELNILNAALLAMKRAICSVVIAEYVLIDGNKLPPGLNVPAQTIVKGDGTSAAVAAASVLAKVARDRYMRALDKEYPQYFFAKHKGYGTALHYQALREFGACPVHRPSFLKKMH